MKIPLPYSTPILGLLVAGLAFSRFSAAADDAPPVPPPPPLPPPAPVFDVPVPEPPPAGKVPPGLGGVPEVTRMISRLDRQLQSQLSQVGAVVQDVMTLLPGTIGIGDGLARQGPRPGRTLVLPTGGADANTSDTEEDLNVMARILEKALANTTETDDRRAMGIAISALGPTASAPRNLYLEGYGALFFVDVNFPLLPPPKKAEETKAKAPASSEWEEARREIEAARTPEPRTAPGGRNGPRGGADYDADKVGQLKDDLLESLKNASHIRDLKPEESITVVVTGSAGNRPPRYVVRKNVGDGKNGRGQVEEIHRDILRGPGAMGAAGESTMTMRVKKADADAFAAGKLELEEFRKRATTRTY